MKSREIDFDNDNHILFDKWIYISIDNQVTFEDVCKLIEKTHLLRMDLQKIIHSNIQDLQSLPFLSQQQYAILKENIGELDKENNIIHQSKQFTMDKTIPNPIRLLKTSMDCKRDLPSIDMLKGRFSELMKVVIPFSVEDISENKVKALFVIRLLMSIFILMFRVLFPLVMNLLTRLNKKETKRKQQQQ